MSAEPPILVLNMRDRFEHTHQESSPRLIYLMADFGHPGPIGRLCDALAYFSTGFVKAEALHAAASARLKDAAVRYRTPDEMADEITRRCSTVQARRRAAGHPTSWADLRPIILDVVSGR